MSEITLIAETRGTGKQTAKRLRNEGKVPGIYYFRESDPVAIAATPLALRNIVHTRISKIVNLQIDGSEEQLRCILKDVTFDPVTDKMTHFDLMGIKRGQKFTMEFPITTKGLSIGERMGGMVLNNMRKVQITCFPRHIPEAIEIDITNLNIGQSVHIRDLQIENVEFTAPPESVVVSVVPPRVTAKGKGEKE
ncbi:MAG: large subunit ribosomal protein [Bacteroidota bacterium]|nr:large subunit ribosomal protein [Bacteroidota bacterium]